MRKLYTLLAAASLAAVPSLYAQETPAELYLVGTPNNWTTPDLAAESDLIVLPYIGDGRFEGTFSFDSATTGGILSFKIFSEKSNWDNQEAYWGASDYHTVIMTAGETQTWEMAQGWEGYDFVVENWTSGEGTVTVDWTTKTLSLSTDAVAELPESLHLAGVMNGWDPADHTYTLRYDGNGYYIGTFDLGPDDFEFKILADDFWAENYGYGGNLELYSDYDTMVYIYENGANITCSNWQGGEVTMIVNYLYKTLVFNTPDQPANTPQVEPEDVVYLIGTPQGWDISSDAMKLTRVSEEAPVYSNTFAMPAGELIFRFYTALGDWESNSIGSQYDDIPVEIAFYDNAFSGDAVWGKGSWLIPDWNGNEMIVTVNLADMTVYFADATTSVGSVKGDKTLSFANGVAESEGAITVADAAGRIVLRAADGRADLSSLQKGLYIVTDGKDAIKVMK